ncbi:leucine carboxyl methyltransferase [Atractiella rhizophila]|nr:leucine carboxyl methyltransferase [Atractiella rhizophila]
MDPPPLPPLIPTKRTLQSTARILQTTDTDALLSRHSAISLGYLQDPYTSLFLTTPLPPPQSQRRPPLINQGTFVRTWAVDRIVQAFLDHAGEEGAQVVNLGAGSDTRFWRMSVGRVKRWVEVDFESSTKEKIARIVREKQLMEAVGSEEDVLVQNEATLYSTEYCILPCDLSKDFDALTTNLLSPFPGSGNVLLLSPLVPTLFIAECVFVYMSPSSSLSILRWFHDTFREAGVAGLTYEMVDKGDEFGRVMKQNLKNRQIHIPGVLPAKEKEQFSKAGFKKVEVKDLKTIRRVDVPRSELERIAKLEMLDEIEELELILEHYCLAWAVDAPQGSKLPELITL